MTKKLLFIFLMLLPITLVSQSNSKLVYDNVPLSEVFKDLEEKYDVVFSYTASKATEQLIQYKGESIAINKLLEQLLKNSTLQYELVSEDYIVVSEVEKQMFRLCGSFKNESGEVLPFVNVFIRSLGVGSSGDDNGNFNWSIELIGNEVVELSYIGYETTVISAERLLECPELVLKTAQFSFEEVIVKEYVTSGIEQSKDLDHMVMRPDKINAVPGLTDADVLQMVQLLPGVQSVDESASGLYIRGGTPDQNLILYDGVPVYNSGHFFGMISGFNPSLVETVDVYRSGFGAEYGGRISGVIDIESTSQIPSRLEADAGINFTHGDVSVYTPVFSDKVGLVLGVRKSYTDIVETPTYKKLSSRVFRRGKLDEVMEEQDEEEEIDFNLVFDFVDYNAKLLLAPSPRDNISLSYFRMEDNLNFDYSEGEDDFATNDKLNQMSYGIGFSWKRDWSGKFKSTLQLSHTQMDNNYQFSIQDGDELGSEIEDLQSNFIEDNTLIWTNSWKFNKRFDLEFGGQFADLLVRSQWQVDPTSEDVELRERKIATGFLTIGTAIGERLKSKFGLRYNQSIGNTDNSFEPRLDIQFFPSDNWQIRANAGSYRQFMNQVIEFNDLGINQDFWVLAEEEEEEEDQTDLAKSTNYSFGVTFHPKSFLFEVEGYYRDQDGLRSNLSRFQIESVSEFDLGKGKSWGVDVLLKKRWNKWQSWIAYSYSRTKYELEIEEQFIDFNAPHDRPHFFRFVQQWNNERWNVSLNWSIASGLSFTEAQGLDVEEEEQIVRYDLEDINLERLPVTHRLDASISYNFIQRKNYTGKIGCSFLNIYDNENLMSREYFAVYEDDIDGYELQARDRSMLRFTPNLVVRFSFH